jgi:hypothetical protein
MESLFFVKQKPDIFRAQIGICTRVDPSKGNKIIHKIRGLIISLMLPGS